EDRAMDFGFSEEQEALRELARKILGDHTAHDRLKEIEKGPDWFDHALWMELAKANLLGVALPAEVGGSGLGFLELCVLLEEVGRAVAPVPIWPTLCLGALPVNQFGTPEQRERLLPKVVSGEGILTAALVEINSEDPTSPATTARADGRGWRLDRVKVCGPAAHLAHASSAPPGRPRTRSASPSSTRTHPAWSSPARRPPTESPSSAWPWRGRRSSRPTCWVTPPPVSASSPGPSSGPWSASAPS